MSKQQLKLKKPTKTTTVKYFLEGQEEKIKVRIYGKVRKHILTQISNTIYFLPEPIKEYLPEIVLLNIVKNGDRKTVTGSFWKKNYHITLYDRSWMSTLDYSADFMHELGHLIYEQFMVKCYNIGEDDEFGDRSKEYLQEYEATVNSKHIKPITYYSHQKKNNKEDFADLNYAEELFAEYIGFTYSRFNNPSSVEGTFCNYLLLRNAINELFDAVEFD